jgi:hypothetical protein
MNKLNTGSEEQMKQAKELIVAALEKLMFMHRHKSFMGGCEECRVINNMKLAIEELSRPIIP